MTARELAGAARTRSRSRESGLLNIPLWRGFIVAAIFLFAALLVAGPKRAAGASWFRHPNCTSPCSEADHTCTDANINSCRYAWGSCPNGTVQTALGSAVDMADCLPPTDCTPGGCEEGWAEVAKTACIDVKKCLAHAGFCYSETCCRVKPQATCCPQLDCTVRYEDCDVAQQRVLNDTSRSDVGRTRIAHTGSAAFPFYSAPHAGRKDNGEQHAGGGSTAGHQARVAVVVVACVLAAGGCVLGVSWCCGLLPDVRSLLRLRGATYEPMFTGQSYTPGLTSPPSATAPADIPWNRFLAALQDLYGRVRYGRRYRLEGESAAAAAERYRRLISGGGYGVGPDGLGGGRLEEEEEDEVFTLDERPARPVGLMTTGQDAGRRR
eukprot:XP_001698986.1 predicted protein [Chlamydomonas reinhardtii]